MTSGRFLLAKYTGHDIKIKEAIDHRLLFDDRSIGLTGGFRPEIGKSSSIRR